MLSFSRSFLASPHRACHERGETRANANNGRKAQFALCGTWATGYRTGLLYPDTQINTPHVVKTSCVEFTVKRGRPARRPAIQLANDGFFRVRPQFAIGVFRHRTCRTVTPPNIFVVRRERGEKSSVFVRVRVLACRPSTWSTAACRVSHGRRHDEAARPSTSRCGTMPMALVSAAAQVQTLETRASACTVQVVPAPESSFVLACQRTVSSCQRTVRSASFSACAPALRENRLPSQKPPRPYSSKPSPPHWSASVIAFC